MKFFQFSTARTLSFVLLVGLISGCGGGDGGSAASASQTSPSPGAGNAAPTIQGQPGTSIVAGQAYSFQPSASDANQDSLTFSVSNLPAWASFNTTTGRLSGTPTDADVATYSNITIAVSDGVASASIGPFAIAVTAMGSGVATLSWTPPTQNSDGSALTDLAGYEVRYGRSADDLPQSVQLSNPSLSTCVVENLASGTWYFAVAAVNTRGVTSPSSNVASKTIS
jgi:hypothetical protein